jgi:hypothetical protein
MYVQGLAEFYVYAMTQRDTKTFGDGVSKGKTDWPEGFLMLEPLEFNDTKTKSLVEKYSQREFDLNVIFNVWKAKERNVVFRIDKNIVKKLNNTEIDRKILRENWKKKFFHLSDSYKFEFGGDCDFYLNYNSNKETDGYDINFTFLKKHVIGSLKEMWTIVDTGKEGTYNLSKDPQDNKFIANIDLFRKIHPFRRKGLEEFVYARLNEGFSGPFFSYDILGSKDGSGVSALANQAVKCLMGGSDPYAKSREKIKDGKPDKLAYDSFMDVIPEDDPLREVYEKAIDKLCLCLEFLNFSHHREFVTQNRSLTKNQRRAARGLHPKKKFDRLALKGEKIIELPRKEYLSYMRNSKSGTHASPEGHIREKHDRTYKHPRFINMQGRTVKVRECKVNGGPKGDRRSLVYSVKPSSNMVKDLVKNLLESDIHEN